MSPVLSLSIVLKRALAYPTFIPLFWKTPSIYFWECLPLFKF